MFHQQKKRLYISDLLSEPAMLSPAYYTLSASLMKNELLLSTIESLHSYDFSYYSNPKSYKQLFDCFRAGSFAIYKELYIVGYFGSKMMYLQSNGWKAMPANEDIFKMDNWLIA